MENIKPGIALIFPCSAGFHLFCTPRQNHAQMSKSQDLLQSSPEQPRVMQEVVLLPLAQGFVESPATACCTLSMVAGEGPVAVPHCPYHKRTALQSQGCEVRGCSDSSWSPGCIFLVLSGQLASTKVACASPEQSNPSQEDFVGSS